MKIKLILVGILVSGIAIADTWERPSRTVIENTLGDKVGVTNNRLNVQVQNNADIVITDGVETAAVLNTGSNDSLAVAVVDSSGNQIESFGGVGVQYTEGDIDTTITGNAAMWEDAGDTLRVVSATYPLPVSVSSLPLPTNAAQETGGNLATLAGKDFATETTLSTLNSKDLMLGTDFSNVFGTASLISATPAVKVEQQGVVHVDDNSGSLTVDGTVTANAGTGNFNVNLQDGAGTDLTSTLVGSDQALDVNVVQSAAVPVTDNGGSLTVDASALDIRALTSSDVVSAVQSGTWDIGTLSTITNVVHVDDNAGSLTIDGTVSISGTVPVDSEMATDDLDTDTTTDTQAIVGIALPGLGGHTLWDGSVTIQEPLSVDDNGGSLTIDGTVGVSGDVAIVNSATSGKESIAINDGGNVISIDDGGGSITVDGAVTVSATALDIRALTSSDVVSAVQSGSWTVGLSAGTNNIGDVDVLASGNAIIDASALPDTNAGASVTLGSYIGAEVGVPVGLSLGYDNTTDAQAYRALAVNASGQLEISDGGNVLSVDDAGGSLTVDGTVSIGSALPAGTNNIGDVDVVSLPSIPAGTNNIGDVDVASIAAGDNNIGNVDIVTMPAVTIAASQTLDTVNTITNVVHVDDNASTLSVDDGGGSLTVDGTVNTTAQNIGTAAPTVYNVTMTDANTEYSQALTNVKSLMFQCRGDYDIRYAFVSGQVATPTEPYMTLKAGAVYSEQNFDGAADFTVYFACGTAGQTVEIEVK